MAYTTPRTTSRSTGAARPLPRRSATLALLSAALGLVGDPRPASACGCFTPPDPASAIVQAGENIVFSADNGQITAYIQIQYSGAAKDFGWLLPLPSVPTLEVGSDEVFSTLTAATAPRYHTTVTYPNDCAWGRGGPSFGEAADLGSFLGGADGGVDGAPQSPLVVEGGIGPYDYAVLKADSKQAMLDWLGKNHYFVPTGTDSVVAPYIHPGAYFLALKLHSGASSGDIQPVVVHYASDLPMIPLVLTSVTSSPNLGVWVWVLGSARAIPRNYHHVVLDDAALAWTPYDSGYTALANYEEVLSRAVKSVPDKHAFVTEMAAPSAPLLANLFPPSRFGDLDTLRQTTDAGLYLDYLQARQYSFNGTLVTILSKYIKQPPDIIPLTGGAPISAANYFYNFRYWRNTRPEAFVNFDLSFDAKALTDEIEAKIVKPVRDAQALFEKAKYLTRLHTWLAPEDMTADPVFSFNPSLPDVSNQHDAQLTMRCGAQRYTFDSSLATEQGFVLDSTQKARPLLPWALRVEYLRESGPPQVLTDNTEAIRTLLGNNEVGGGAGAGGCTVDGGERASGARTALLLGLLPLAFVLRAVRKRRRLRS